ncbi:TPA: hypothetical protein ACY37S_002421, partial [Pasteurella multocida]
TTCSIKKGVIRSSPCLYGFYPTLSQIFPPNLYSSFFLILNGWLQLEEATKRRSTIATLEKAVNAEKTLIISEISSEGARIAERRKMIPIHYEYLFKDWQSLISGEQDLAPIISERIAEEEKREAEAQA